MRDKQIGVAIIGCGNIAGAYAKNLAAYPEIKLLGATDIDLQRAESLAQQYGAQAYPSTEAVLADEAVDLVVNLTIHHAHTQIITQCLEAGKHVYSEKPLSLTYEEAKGLVDLAQRRGLRLGCSPFTYMGEPQQTAWKVIQEGRLGPVRLIYAEVNHGRIETWHPAPPPFYQVGALFDVGVYPLTIVTAMFGPARKVLGYGRVLYPDRVTKEGVPFHIDTPDFITAVVELEGGLLVRLTTNFYVGGHTKQRGIEFHGDLGSLHLGNWQRFDTTVEFTEYGQNYQPVPNGGEAFWIWPRRSWKTGRIGRPALRPRMWLRFCAPLLNRWSWARL
jgi:predicted dehydrogenase